VTRYRTIVADPPWHYDGFGIGRAPKGCEVWSAKTPLPYVTMTPTEIAALPVASLAENDAHLYLWTTNRYLPDAFDVVKSWGFRYSTPLVWAKTPMPTMIGGAFRPSAEFVLFCRRGKLPALRREVTQWWNWPRQGHNHSRKPEAFLDLVESMSPGPYLEMFARRNRLGWDTWGDEALEHVTLGEPA
jgi:N6-adenosine-specific RNA methylase IME4